jgi:hypothetical protein
MLKQRYVYVLANQDGSVLEPAEMVKAKVRTKPRTKKSKAAVATPKASNDGILSNIPPEVGQAAVSIGTSLAAQELGVDLPSTQTIVPNEGGTDWLDVTAGAAPAVGAVVGSLIPGLGTVIGTGIGTAVSVGIQLFDD